MVCSIVSVVLWWSLVLSWLILLSCTFYGTIPDGYSSTYLIIIARLFVGRLLVVVQWFFY